MSYRPGIPLRAEDALFLHAQSPLLCQQVGAVLLLEPAAALDIGALREVITQRVRAIPTLRHRLERAPGRWRRPRWVADEGDISPRIREVRCGQDGNPRTLGGIVDTFFSLECDPYRSPWEVWLIPGAPDGRTAVAVKIHHALGDSHAIIAALTRLLDPTPDGPGRRPAAGRTAASGPQGRRTAADRARGAGARLQDGLRAVRGLTHLAAAGAAPEVSVCGPFTGGRRRYVQAVLPAWEVARTARGLDTQIADLLLAVTAEALGRLLRARGEETAGQVVRIAVPRACPVRGRGRTAGTEPRNRTAAVTLDAPIGPAAPAQRLAAVRGQVAARVDRGDAAAAAMVLRVMNFLPLPLQRLAAVQFYQRRWFNLLVSVFPGARRSYSLLGARVEEAYPVLALADGAGLAIGAMTWERSLSVGILADAALVPDVDKLAAEIPAAFELYRAAAQA
ncbi:MAG TPA: wax ester/triacylglycerol synthase domain-containing protein [Trebonia sp.]|nr:wax ester/triacylglycerol synthase domain-containing protein [Trebonia sp.]